MCPVSYGSLLLFAQMISNTVVVSLCHCSRIFLCTAFLALAVYSLSLLCAFLNDSRRQIKLVDFMWITFAFIIKELPTGK